MSIGLLQKLCQFYNLYIRLSTDAEKLCVKIGAAVTEILSEIFLSLLSHLKRCSCYSRNLRSYWAKVHHICTRCRRIIVAIKPLIHIVIFHSVLKCQGVSVTFRTRRQKSALSISVITELNFIKLSSLVEIYTLITKLR